MSHLYDNRHYVIFDCTELSTIDFSQVYETSETTVRKSVDETQTFVKYNYVTVTNISGSVYDTVPSSIEALTTKSTPYSYEEILSILATPVWTDPSDPK
jgi:hypothetical protein|tara:strand:+ start:871 stop:1167 length:297 start_codon:yes stop_codon:yes gene_type:complete